MVEQDLVEVEIVEVEGVELVVVEDSVRSIIYEVVSLLYIHVLDIILIFAAECGPCNRR